VKSNGILAIIQVQASKREERMGGKIFQVMYEWNIYCSLSIIQEEEKEEWGKKSQLMNE
jgi:hypothetical protein